MTWTTVSRGLLGLVCVVLLPAVAFRTAEAGDREAAHFQAGCREGRVLHDAADARSDEEQAGRRPDLGRHDRHSTAARGRSESRRLFHEAGAGGRVRGDDVPSRGAQRDRAGRRPAVEGSGEEGALRHGRAWRVETGGRGSGQSREAHARRGVGGAAAGQARFRGRAVLPVRERSAGARRAVHRVRAHGRRPRRRAEDLRDGRGRRRPAERSRGDRVGHHSRYAAARADPVRDGDRRAARALARDVGDDDGADRAGVHAGQGAGARAEFPAAGEDRRLRRHCVPPRRAGIRRAGRRDDEPRHAAVGEAARAHQDIDSAGVQRHAARQRHRVDGARSTIRRARRRRSSSARGRRRRSTTNTPSSAASSTACPSSKRSSRRRAMAKSR